jgi:predicted O-methyltransferase YrrM
MSKELWASVDDYVSGLFVPPDTVLDAVLLRSEAAGLPAIQVTPALGKLLHLLARLQRAERILEIGTLAAYSTIWLARALPAEGRLITLEFNPKHAEVARGNLADAGLSEKVEVRLGSAAEGLQQLAREKSPPFDLIFIDADKAGYPEYLRLALPLSRPGTLLVADNVVRNGAVADASSPDPDVQGVRRFNEMLAKEPRLSATVMQTVGGKGYDGFALAIVNS